MTQFDWTAWAVQEAKKIGMVFVRKVPIRVKKVNPKLDVWLLIKYPGLFKKRK